MQMVIFRVAFHLVTTLVTQAVIYKVTILGIDVLMVVNMTLGLVGVVGPPIFPLKILCDVLMKIIVRHVAILMVEIFKVFISLMFAKLTEK